MKVGFVLMVPYQYKPDGNAALEDMFTLLEAEQAALQSDAFSVRIVVQPNVLAPRNTTFDLVCVTDLAKPLARVKQLPRALVQVTTMSSHRYQVLHVYPAGANVQVLKARLVVDRTLEWTRSPSTFRFLDVTDSEFKLYRKNDLSSPLARCNKEPYDVAAPFKYRVLEVFPVGAGQVVNGVRLPAVGVTDLAHPVFVCWQQRPRSFVLLEGVAAVQAPNVAHIAANEARWSERVGGNGMVTVLPPLAWHNSGDQQVEIPYGHFRNELMHHRQTVAALQQLKQAGHAEVYAHVFDPDMVSLRVNTTSSLLPGTQLLFEVYSQQLREWAEAHGGKYPDLASSMFCFDATDDCTFNLNRLFELNTTVNKKLHGLLPAAGYFSECNTLLRFADAATWEVLKFARDANEIMPIVKALRQSAVYLPGALPTSVPPRMQKWCEHPQNLLVQDLVENDRERREQGGANYFVWLEDCPQVTLGLLPWAHHVSSALSGFVTHEPGWGALNAQLCKLWASFSPVQLFLQLTEKAQQKRYVPFRDFVRAYDDKLKLQAVTDNLTACMTALKEQFPFKDNAGPLTWERVQDAARQCGQEYAKHLAEWCRVDEQEEPFDEHKIDE